MKTHEQLVAVEVDQFARARAVTEGPWWRGRRKYWSRDIRFSTPWRSTLGFGLAPELVEQANAAAWAMHRRGQWSAQGIPCQGSRDVEKVGRFFRHAAFGLWMGVGATAFGSILFDRWASPDAFSPGPFAATVLLVAIFHMACHGSAILFYGRRG